MFEKGFFKRNRGRLLEKSNCDIVAIAANGLLQRSADTAYPFRQDSNFWYLTGLDLPDALLVITREDHYVVLPPRHSSQVIMEGDVDAADIARQAGVEVIDYSEGAKRLRSQLAHTKRVGACFPAPAYIKYYGLHTNPARARAVRMLRRNGAKELVDMRKILGQLRSVKQPQEIRAIQEAIRITETTLGEVFSEGWQKKYHDENMVKSAITAGFVAKGSQHAFEPVVGAGQNAVTIHSSGNNPIKSGDLVLVDIGAEYSNYSADICRTLCAGKPSKRQLQVLEAVYELQDFAIKQIRLGKPYRELETDVEQKTGEVLVNLGVITANIAKNVRKYFPHRVSHYLGLDTHDAGDYDAILAENMVLAIEPGIYIPEEGIGVRIEDDVLVTKNGTRVLSDKLPRRLW